MRIIKDKQISDNVWLFADADGKVSDKDNMTVPLERWKNQNQQLVNRSGKTGIRLVPTDAIQDMVGNLDGIDLIELDFPGFGDGRLFSHARLLRSRLGYQGEIRAVGRYLPDQVFFLSRVGVNSFELQNEDQIPLALSCFSDFTVTYQPSSN